MLVRAAIGLGSNIGDSPAHLVAAVDALNADSRIHNFRISSFHCTKPVGITDQPDFLNAAAIFATALSAPELLSLLLSIEKSRGRDRSKEQRWGPRSLDLDLLLYGDQVINLPGLTVPHPLLQERTFVLTPLAEIASEWQIPPRNVTVAHALASLSR